VCSTIIPDNYVYESGRTRSTDGIVCKSYTFVIMDKDGDLDLYMYYYRTVSVPRGILRIWLDNLYLRIPIGSIENLMTAFYRCHREEASFFGLYVWCCASDVNNDELHGYF